jgi:predicted transporter
VGWMVGSFLPWMGAWILANQLSGRAAVSPLGAFGLTVACSVALAVAAVLIHFPGASWGLGTFGVAFLPGVALATVISGLAAKRA